MSNVRVSVVLNPYSITDTLSPRTFTLCAQDQVFDIGRASKRDSRNRIPAPDNGWFDSRVMSRDHARFSVCLDKKNIYVCDMGSTHGTWLNNVKLLEGELTPLIHGDVLRFGIDIDRGDEGYPALSFACKIYWIDSPDNKRSIPTQYAQSLEIAETKPSTGSELLSGLQPSSSTNTFRVPDDSDVEEIPCLTANYAAEPYPRKNVPVVQLDGQKDIHDSPEVRDTGSVILEEQSDDYSESGEEESALESNTSLSSDSSIISFAVHGVELKSECESDEDYECSERSDSESESEQESELESDIDDASSIAHSVLGLVDDLCKKPWDEDYHHSNDPGVPTQNDQPDCRCCRQSQWDVKAIVTGPGETTVYPYQHSVVAHEELPQCDPLSLQSSPHKDGPFSHKAQTSPGKTASDRTLVKFGDTSLKRKASELEDQGAQVLEPVLPATQANLGTVAQPEVVEAISSALSETEPPKKRVKYSHSSSSTVASYAATAVVSALLGGLGTIVLLAALPAEYFQ